MLLKKNILILVEEKKKSDSEFLSYNLMLKSGGKNHAEAATSLTEDFNFISNWAKKLAVQFNS
jgi:hypothetical protein